MFCSAQASGGISFAQTTVHFCFKGVFLKTGLKRNGLMGQITGPVLKIKILYTALSMPSNLLYFLNI
ncbi:hypothetical protein TH63_17365 [Rufibacter radiotolerans]|uniref:Uncharacterized protein n=1 Tax=Rufibacter radiotolerans TaxID=1379910 RepID=A0A0H4VMC1_9BACT|nr:hypothetical protein TH63_17365 [Rufibacter radiotolerans]